MKIRMPIRVSRRVAVFVDGEFSHECESVSEAAEFLMQSCEISNFNTALCKINRACRNDDGHFLNFKFVKDPNYVSSRPVVAINQITGDYIIKHSVGKMGEHIFGKHDRNAKTKISKLCETGEIHAGTGLVLKYIENGYIVCPHQHSGIRRAILQIDRDTNVVINKFCSVNDAGQHIFHTGVTESSVPSIVSSISSCVNGKSPDRDVRYRYKWRYVRHDEPAENVPLPPVDVEGL